MTDDPNFPDPQPDDPTSDHPTVEEPPVDGTPTDDPPSEDPTVEEPPDDVPPSFPPPTPGPPPGQPRRLVRDPYSRLGGVASGVAHHYGIDVSLVRIVFVLLAFASGVGFLAYLLAWIVIPRADYWPPDPPARPVGGMGRRDVGILLAVLGVIVVIASGPGDFGGFVLPLLLVGGGVWLLTQSDSQTIPAGAGAAGHPGSGHEEGTWPPPAAYAAPSGPTDGPPPPVAPMGQPVPPRRKRRVVALAFFGLLALLAIPLFIAGGLAIALATGNLDLDLDGDKYDFVPVTAEEFPARIDHEAGELEIDLRLLDEADFADLDEPVRLDAELEFGQIIVRVPDDLDVSVDASAGFGHVEVFNRDEGGFSPSIDIDRDDAHVEIDLDVGAGDVRVVRG